MGTSWLRDRNVTAALKKKTPTTGRILPEDLNDFDCNPVVEKNPSKYYEWQKDTVVPTFR